MTMTAMNKLQALVRKVYAKSQPVRMAEPLPTFGYPNPDPEHQGFINSIAAAPHDNAPKLIFADWLDEHGKHDEAARIRWMVQAQDGPFHPEELLNQQGPQRRYVYPDLRAGIYTDAMTKIHGKYGPHAAMLAGVLHQKIMSQHAPTDWSMLEKHPENTSRIERMQPMLDGAQLGNELGALGVTSPMSYAPIERVSNIVGNTASTMIGGDQPADLRSSLRGIISRSASAGRQAIVGPTVHYHSTAQRPMVYADPIMPSERGAENAMRSAGHTHADIHQDLPHMTMNLLEHPHWDSFPKPQQLSMLRRARLALKLDRSAGKDSEAPPPMSITAPTSAATIRPVDDMSFMSHPEKQWLNNASTKSIDQYHNLVTQANDPRAKEHTGVIPHVNTLTSLAQLGSPTKGEYERTYRTIQSLFGHDPDGVTAWQAVNGVMSPNTAYKDHAGAASLIVANWLAAKKPKDEHSIRRLVEAVDTFGKQYTPKLAAQTPWSLTDRGKYTGLKVGETFGGTTAAERHKDAVVRVLQNVHKLRDAFIHPEADPGQRLGLLAGGGLLKVPNFTVSYSAPHIGAALDVHMARMMFHPMLDDFEGQSDLMKQIRGQLSNPGELDALQKKSLKGVPVRSDLVRLLMRNPNVVIKGLGGSGMGTTAKDGLSPPALLKEINYKLISKPQVYLAYKNAVAQAAKQLGWTPSEVQESVWTGIVALMAANSVGIKPAELQKHLSNDAIAKGWNNAEALYFPGLADAYARNRVDPAVVRRVAAATKGRAAASSRSGVLPVRDWSAIQRIATLLPGSSGRDAADGIKRALIAHFKKMGLFDPRTGKLRASKIGEQLQLAKYDAPLDFGPAQDRIMASNQQVFTEHMRQILQQAGIVPHQVTPAIHDVGGAARASILATGKFVNPAAPQLGAAWTGLLGRQPGMLAFTSHPQGPDSVYHFKYPNVDVVKQALDQVGVINRVIVPDKTHYNVYVYDRGGQLRQGMASALTRLGVVADEWKGQGNPVGGDVKDMGRAQYRTEINKSEQL